MPHSQSLLSLFVVATLAPAATHTVSFTVTAGKHDRKNEVVCVPFGLPKTARTIHDVTIFDARGKKLTSGQVVEPGLTAQPFRPGKGQVRRDLYFVLPKLEAGAEVALEARISVGEPPRLASGDFYWEAGDGVTTLLHGDGPRSILRYVHPKYNDSTPSKRDATFKVFHEVFSPDGKQLLTKGVGGEFTHHRGLFYGFMKTTYGTDIVDIWHCKNDTHQAHRAIVSNEEGPVLGRHRVAIDWNGVKKETFAREQRELTAFAVPGGTLIEFASHLTPTGPEVKLDGDPQHAGFHFRASNEVASKTKKQTIFIRPDGEGKPGTEVNWPNNKKHVNLPWLGMSFVVGEKRYTVTYLDRPGNPKEARFSERTYGRVGSYFVTSVTKEKPLVVVYRVWVQEGKMTTEQIAARSRAFVEPVRVKLK